MANLFNKLPGYARTPPGRERKILRWLPKVLLFGSVLLALPSLLVRMLPMMNPPLANAKLVTTVDIYCISLLILFWIVLFTVAIGAFVVMVMKGPAYVADPYPLSDSDSPGAPPSRENS